MKLGKGFWPGVIVAVILILAVGVYTGKIPISLSTAASPPSTTVTGGATQALQCSVIPTYTYSAFDSKATATAVGGTNNIKVGSAQPVSSLANPPAGQALEFWQSNASYFCDVVGADSNIIPATGTGQALSGGAQTSCSSNLVQGSCYANATVTLSVYSTPANTLLTNGGGANNLSTAVGANNINLYYQGSSKQSSMPFGGCVALEYPSNVTSVSISGAGITGAACPYTWTYLLQNTADSFKLFAVPAGFDQNGAADLKSIAVSYTASTNKPLGKFYITFQPANWYVGTFDKSFHMGIEKDANADTTKTFSGQMQTTFVGQ